MFARSIAPGAAWHLPGAPFLLAAAMLLAADGAGLAGDETSSLRPVDMRLRRVLLWVCLLPASVAAVFALYVAWLGLDFGAPSTCRGSIANGSLESGRRLPYSGENYRAYSLLGYLLGRTFVHDKVRNAMRDAYADLARSHPDLRFVYAETSWPWGGNFAPHKTHANGTSVDFHVPTRTDGQVSELPTSPFNQFGYSVEFDGAGRAGSLLIDFEAMGLHLLALDKAARANGTRIQRVIFDPALHSKLAASPGRRPGPGPPPLHEAALLGAARRALPRRFRRALPIGNSRSFALEWAGIGVHNSLRRRDNRGPGSYKLGPTPADSRALADGCQGQSRDHAADRRRARPHARPSTSDCSASWDASPR